MTNPEITAAKKLGARAAQRLDALRAAIVRADEAQTAATDPSRGRRRLGRARPPRDHPGERLPARGRAGRPDPAALGHQSVSRRWRGRDR